MQGSHFSFSMSTIDTRIRATAVNNPGVGCADTSRFDFETTLARDRRAVLAGTAPAAAYMAFATGRSTAATRHRLLEEMVYPCGLPPARPDFPPPEVLAAEAASAERQDAAQAAEESTGE